MPLDIAQINSGMKNVAPLSGRRTLTNELTNRLWSAITKPIYDEVVNHGRCVIEVRRIRDSQLFLQGADGKPIGEINDPLGIAQEIGKRMIRQVIFTMPEKGCFSAVEIEKVLLGAVAGGFEPLEDTGVFHLDEHYITDAITGGLPLHPNIQYVAVEEGDTGPGIDGRTQRADRGPQPTEKQIALNKALKAAGSPDEIIEIGNREMAGFDAFNITIAIIRLAKLLSNDLEKEQKNIIAAIAAAAVGRIDEFDASGLANMAWAFAKLGFGDQKLFEAIATAAVKKINEFKPRNLSNLAWAYATLGISNQNLFEAVAATALKKINEFNAQNLSNTAWAYATLGNGNSKLFGAIAVVAIKKMSGFNAQNLSNTAWAYAKQGILDQKLFEAIAAETLRKMGDFNAQNLSNTAWAYARLRILDQKLFEALAAEAVRKMGEFNAQNLSNTAWAYARMRIGDQRLFEAIAAAAVQKIDSFKSQNLANTICAYAKLGMGDQTLFEAIAAEVVRKIDKFNPQEITKTAWACAKLEIGDQKLFRVLAAAVVRKIDNLKPQEIIDIAQAFITAGQMNERFYAELSGQFILDKYVFSKGKRDH